MSGILIRALTGPEILDAVEDLARLRMTVFADWPYLYDGEAAYEEEYLREFLEAPQAVLVAAFDGSAIVGAATASPMSAQKEEFRSPFEARGFDVARQFYFGESVLLPQYRGQGIGHAFFDRREAQARDCRATSTVFAAVVRSEDHPARPDDYVPLDGFWRKRGYEPVSGLVTELAWKEHGEGAESPKTLQYWWRDLSSVPNGNTES